MSMIEQKQTVEPDDLPDALAKWRGEIIDDILENGLKSGRTLQTVGRQYLGSADAVPFGRVEGCLFRPSSHYRNLNVARTHISDSLYAGAYSIFPVLAERPPHMREDLKLTSPNNLGATFAKRMASSFLVVCKSVGDTMSKSEDELLPHHFAYLVFPEAVWQEYSKKENSLGIPVKIVSKAMDRRAEVIRRLLTIPDYESAILDILEEVNHPIWVHGVRLPTDDDVWRNSEASNHQ